MSWSKIGRGTSSVLLTLFGLSFLALALWFLYAGRDSVGTAIAGAIACLLLPHIPAMTKFKFGLGGVEAEMKQVIEDAKASVAQLHELAATQAAATIQQIAAEGRWGGGMSVRSKEDLRQQIIASLRTIGLPEERIQNVDRADEAYVLFDYVGYVVGAIKQSSLSKEQKEIWQTSFKNHSLTNPCSPRDLRAILLRMDHLSDEAEQRVLDYEHYAMTGTHRSIERWLTRYEKD